MASTETGSDADSQTTGFANGSRVPALDGVRGIAILLVLNAHQSVADVSGSVDRLVKFWTGAGWMGVDLFFVLSGFLITGILQDSKGSPGFLRNFYARRVLRIFPLYYAFLLFWIVLIPRLQPGAYDETLVCGVCYWVYLQNVAFSLAGTLDSQILAISWSLAIEEQFYLIWPFMVLLLGRRALMRTCIALIAVSLGLRLLFTAIGAHQIAVSLLTPMRMDGLATGALIALALRGEGEFRVLARRAPLVTLVSLLGIVGLAAWAGGFEVLPGPLTVLEKTPFQIIGLKVLQMMGITLVAGLFGSLLVIVIARATQGRSLSLLEFGPLTAVGKYSYAMYLFHQPVGHFFMARVYGPEQFFLIMGSALPAEGLFRVAATSLTFFLAWLSWNLFESRFLSLKRYVQYRKPRQVVPHRLESPAPPGPDVGTNQAGGDDAGHNGSRSAMSNLSLTRRPSEDDRSVQ